MRIGWEGATGFGYFEIRFIKCRYWSVFRVSVYSLRQREWAESIHLLRGGGDRGSLHTGAPGRVMLAWLPRVENKRTLYEMP